MRRGELEFGILGSDAVGQCACVTDELVVHVDDSDAADQVLGGVRSARAEPRRVGSFEVWSLPTGSDVVGSVRRARPLRVSPHYVFGASAGARVPMTGFPLFATNGRLEPATAATGPSPVKVAVIDTGLLLGAGGAPHPWFGGRVTFVAADADPLPGAGLLDPATGHGTVVAGVVLGEAPAAQVLVRRVLAAGVAPDEAVAAAIGQVAADGATVINLSFAGDVLDEGEAPPIIDEALAALADDVVVVAAAGNHGDTRPVWPAASKRVVAVGAVEEGAEPRRALFSSHGAWVDAYAPGVALVAPFCVHQESGADGHCRPAQRFEGWARATGTSVAAAVVAGRIARAAADGGLTAMAARNQVLAMAQPVTVGSTERPLVVATAKVVV